MEITRESIFTSSVRSFFNAFFAFVGVIIGLVIVSLILGSFVRPKHSTLHTTVVIEPDAKGNIEFLPATTPVILRIDIDGPIMPPSLTYQMVEKQLADSRKGFLAGDRVKAILLFCDTPGGTITDSNGIYSRLMDYKKQYNVPIYSFTEGTCASGGVFISSAADKTFATNLSLIGSVGVILGPVFNFSKLMDKVGIEAKTITEGKSKEILPFWKPWEPDAGEELVPIAKQTYDVFVKYVTEARKDLSEEKLRNEYGAKVFDAPTAAKYGYIEDGNASYGKALTELAKAANIDGDYQVVRLKVRTTLVDSLLKRGDLMGMLKKKFSGAQETQDKLLYLYQTQ
jgi:protease IV